MNKRMETSRSSTSQIVCALHSPEKDNSLKKSKKNVTEILKFGPKQKLQERCTRATARPRKLHGGKYSIHTIHTLSDLLDRLRTKTSYSQVALRFLLNTDLELLFAEEGDPTHSIPPHYRMTGARSKDEARCYSAGNVTLNENNQIISISNKSGDFHPLYDSLQWVIATIMANGLEFADKVTVTKINPQGSFEDITVSSQQLKELTNDLFSLTELQHLKQINTNLPTRVYECRDPNKSDVPHRKIKRPNFDDIPASQPDNELLDAALQLSC